MVSLVGGPYSRTDIILVHEFRLNINCPDMLPVDYSESHAFGLRYQQTCGMFILQNEAIGCILVVHTRTVKS